MPIYSKVCRPSICFNPLIMDVKLKSVQWFGVINPKSLQNVAITYRRNTGFVHILKAVAYPSIGILFALEEIRLANLWGWFLINHSLIGYFIYTYSLIKKCQLLILDKLFIRLLQCHHSGSETAYRDHLSLSMFSRMFTK